MKKNSEFVNSLIQDSLFNLMNLLRFPVNLWVNENSTCPDTIDAEGMRSSVVDIIEEEVCAEVKIPNVTREVIRYEYFVMIIPV